MPRVGFPESVQLCGWSVTLAAFGYWADVIADSHAAAKLTPAALSASVFGAGAFNAAAWAMIAVRFFSPAPSRPAPALLILLVFSSSLLCVLPMDLALAPALVLLGLGLVSHSVLPGPRREAGLLLLGLGIAWGWPFLRFVHEAAGLLDAEAVSTIMRLSGFDVGIQGNVIAYGDFSIEILPACASSFPLAEIALAYVVVGLYCGRRFSKMDLFWLLASWLFSVVLTEIRLSLMVPNWADWNFWHNGPGSTIYQLIALAGAGFFPWMAARPRPARKAVTA